ncbi:thioredoxin domain-containing protein [Methylobacterium soli]|uniref:Thioredoxin domain-containing protein n=3 Tax=Methylobacterium soli TaxID=553447 RepID=A0A6L3T402_9HYPH|nr:thioredoxin domain-containing protein [Methylobacterium soli]
MSQESSTAAGDVSRVRLRVWIDFVCPYCLLGKEVIRAAIEGLAVDIVWMPFELRPYPTPTLRPEDDYLPAAWKQGVYPTAERMGIAIRLPSVSPQPYTRKAFLGLQYAVEHGQGEAYVDAVLRAFFQQDRDIGDTALLKAIIRELGLDPQGLDAVLASPQYAERHDAALRLAREVGIRAVPSVAVGDRLFSGTPQPDALRAEILRQTAS